MPEWNASPGFLITLAAEAIAPAVAGCAKVFAGTIPGASPADPATSVRAKGISYFGPRIIDRWLAEFGSVAQPEQVGALVQLASLPVAESRREATQAIERYASDTTPADCASAVEYLTAIPLAVRRSLVPDPQTGRLTLSTTFISSSNRTLIRLLPVDVPPFPIGTVLPGTSYQLDELLGLGGFGAVYKARNRFEQNQPPRAIKFCMDPTMVASLHRERAILDRLMAVGETSWSTRIVRLYGYALDVQPPFLVYEYVPGGDLTSYLTGTRQKTGRGFRPVVAMELIRQIAEALAFAHGQGLVHRDLKPANILVSGSTIKLTDFGIGGVVAYPMARGTPTGTAFMLSHAADQASLFRGSGTPLYMSAEQRRGDQPDPRHDLFSLGVVWYQLLVGDVTRELHPGWPDELVEEFQTPAEHIELIQRCVGYFKKRPAHAGDLLALLPESAVQGSEAGPTPQGRSAAVGDEVHCIQQHQGWVRSVALAPDGGWALSGGDDATVRLWDLTNGRELLCLAGHTGAVMSIALNGDGSRAVSGGWDGTLRLWDLANGQQLLCLEGNWPAIKTVALTADGTRGLFAGEDRIVHWWDLTNGQAMHCLTGHTAAIHSVAVSADGRLGLSGSDDHTIRLWDLANGQEIQRFAGHADAVTSVAIAPNGRWVISGSSDNTLRFWDLQSGKELRCLKGHKNWINSVAISADGRRVLTGSGGEVRDGKFGHGTDTTVRLWDVVGGKELHCLEGHTASVTCVALSVEGRVALSGSLDHTVRLWELPK
jgi:serine/threonine protein kinase